MSASIVPESPFIRACLGQPVPHTPVWFMRQAGRALPEYRKVRAGLSMMESCRRPDLVCEITLQPVRRYGVDAAKAGDKAKYDQSVAAAKPVCDEADKYLN